MSTDFGFIAAQAPTKDTIREFKVHGIQLPNGETPVLLGKCGGQVNKPYFNKLMAKAPEQAKLIQSGKADEAMLSDNRDDDRKLYPEFILTGWKKVCDANGRPVEYSTQNCADFIAALPDNIFDDVRNFFGNPSNFMEDLSVSADDAEDLGNSSASD